MTGGMPRCERALFVCDLHLRRDAPTGDHAAFIRFLRSLPGEAAALFLLGDIFEFWIGPEDVRQPCYAPVLSAIGEAVARGAAATFIPGNRDFLVAGELERACGARVAADPTAVDLAGVRAFLTHGDRLCVGDRSYQRMTAVIRGALARGIWLGLPARLRARAARSLRAYSAWVGPAKGRRAREPSWEEVLRILAAGYDVVIAGHAHRQAERTVERGGRVGRFFQLGPWPRYLAFDRGRFEARAFR